MNRLRVGHPRLLIWLAVAGLAVLIFGSAMEGTLVYARTPGTMDVSHPGEQVRLTGTVVPGSLQVSQTGTSFVLEGGGKQISVISDQAPPGTFREGQQAVVEGHQRSDGVFVADRVIAQHGNVYRAVPPR